VLLEADRTAAAERQGFLYEDSRASSDGITRIKLKGGDAA
jgi:hypothetical protein